MTAAVLTCVVGCVSRDQHLPECPGDCWGCLPAIARHGALCSRCDRRLVTILTEDPRPGLTLTEWMLQHVAAPISAPTGQDDPEGQDQRKGKHAAPPAPLRVEVLDWLAEWKVHLAGWVEVVCDQTGLTGPLHPDQPEMLRDWLNIHIETIECADYIEPLMSELGDDVSRAHALAPWREKRTAPKAIPCSCVTSGKLDPDALPELSIYEAEAGDELRCARCGRRYTAEQYAQWAGLVYAAGKRHVEERKGARRTGRAA